MNKALRQVPTKTKPGDTAKHIEILRKALRPIKEDGVGMVGGAPTVNVGAKKI